MAFINVCVAALFDLKKDYTAHEVAAIWGNTPVEVDYWREEWGLRGTARADGSYRYNGMDLAIFLIHKPGSSVRFSAIKHLGNWQARLPNRTASPGLCMSGTVPSRPI